MSASQVQSNFLFGPWKLPAAPKAIAFAPISNRVLNPGVSLSVTNSATDPDVPPLPLAFSLVSAPTNATIDAWSGLIRWRPLVAQANTTNDFSVAVVNNGTPGLGATRNFSVTVLPLANPQLASVGMSNGVFTLSVNGAASPDYIIQDSADLVTWSNVFITTPASLPFSWTDTNLNLFNRRFFRVLLGP